VGEVHGLRLLREHGYFAARIIVALLEGLESGGSVSFETQLRADFGPVELEGGAALQFTNELVFLLLAVGAD
jgi:hypothetical protein